MKLLIHQTISQIVPLLSFYKDGFDNKRLLKVDMSLNKETKLIKRNKGISFASIFFLSNNGNFDLEK